MRSMREVYEVTENQDNNLNLYCFFIGYDFEEAIQEDKWNNTMDKEIKAIKKNDTCPLTCLLQDKMIIDVKWVYKTERCKGRSSNVQNKISSK